MHGKKPKHSSNIAELLCEEFLMFLIGGALYYGLQLYANGSSDLMMIAVGGTCFIAITVLNETVLRWDMLYQTQCLVSGVILTVMEFIYGYILNIKLNMNVWDYSDMMFNFMGQICLKSSINWFVISGIAIGLDDLMMYFLFDHDLEMVKFTHKHSNWQAPKSNLLLKYRMIFTNEFHSINYNNI